MICRQRTQSLAFLRTKWIPMLANCTSASLRPSQVIHGRPWGLLQSLGGRSNAMTAQWWSCLESERATRPKKQSLLVLMMHETGGQPVVTLTEALVTCPVYGIRRIFRRPCVKGIQSSSKSLCDSLCFRSIHQPREDIGLIQPDLCVHQDIWLPNMLLQQHHTILGNTNALEWQCMLKDTQWF